jgi:hypothetical protein
MALRRTRWTHDGADLIKPQPSDGATLPSITDPRPARRAVAHVHVHGGKVADQAAPRRPPAVHGGQPKSGLPLNHRTEDRLAFSARASICAAVIIGAATGVTGSTGCGARDTRRIRIPTSSSPSSRA